MVFRFVFRGNSGVPVLRVRQLSEAVAAPRRVDLVEPGASASGKGGCFGEFLKAGRLCRSG